MARQIVGDVVAGLMHQPRTQAELCEFTGSLPGTVRRVLLDLRECGVVYRSGSRASARPRGHPAVVWALQTKPFAEDDRVDERARLIPAKRE